ncbi:MAG: ATP-dependent DNA ligase [Candidatus Levybacteria bacterium]|nr:ATP-dependent DNA ligase [Candidatus Levybacteria bacterium]
MLFSKFVTYLERLETTSSRLILIDILAELFTIASKEDIDKIIYLTQGRVAPFFAPLEIGMADKTVAETIARSYASKKEDVLALYNKLGDMGKAAQDLNLENRDKNKNLTVADVFNILIKIANTNGEGTVEKRIMLLSGLLVEMNGVSARHLIRIPLGNNRLGIGDPTILDGLALAILGDRSRRKLLEKAYSETSDLGLIGKTLKTDGLDGVRKLMVRVGCPIRSELCERLPGPEKVFEKMSPNGEGVHATPKYDGFRVQIHKNDDDVRMFSRNLEDMTHMFPEIIDGTRKQIMAKTAILDTEALAYQPESEEFLPFQETTKRRRKHNIAQMAEQLPLKAFVFDILYINGKSLLDIPLTERMTILADIVYDGDVLIPAPGKILYDSSDLQKMLDDSISKGLEGVVVKRTDSLYEAGGRNFNWVKLKRHSSGELNDTIDCVVLGYIVGKGKRAAFGAGALLVGVYDKEKDMFMSVSKIGTGLTDEEWKEIYERADKLRVDQKPARVDSVIVPSVWVRPEIVIEILADEITRSPNHTAGKKSAIINGQIESESGYALRFPRLVTFRSADRRPEDATTVNELITMYNQQGKK